MSDVPFHVTRLGRTFYEHQIPELLRQLKKLNANVEALVAALAEPDSSTAFDPEDAEPRGDGADG